MPVELTVASAFLIGLLGSTHCLGMCGGIVGALTLGVAGANGRSRWRLAAFLVAYNAGRVVSYAAAGAALGLIGAQVFGALPVPAGHLAARLVSAGFMIALGLYLTGWWTGLRALERVGARVWRHVEPWARRLFPVRRVGQALLLGLLWGWLPCGLVYAALAWSLGAGSALDGALLMAAFGAGTWPMMFATGALARRLGGAVQRPWARRAAGLVLLAVGLYALIPWGSAGGHHHAGATGWPAATPAAQPAT